VGGDNFWAYVVLDATAELSAVAAHVDDAVVDELVEMYRSFVGEHPNWGEFRRTWCRPAPRAATLPDQRYGRSTASSAAR